MAEAETKLFLDGREFFSGDWWGILDLFIEGVVMVHRDVNGVILVGDICFQPVFVREDFIDVSFVVYFNIIHCLVGNEM